MLKRQLQGGTTTSKLKRELSDGSLSSKKWWNTVNILSGKSTTADIPVFKDEHQAYTSANDKAEKFCQTFATKCQLDNADEPTPQVQHSTASSKEQIAFRTKDVRKLLRNLQPDKATSSDEIPARILKGVYRIASTTTQQAVRTLLLTWCVPKPAENSICHTYLQEGRKIQSIHVPAHLPALYHQEGHGGCRTEPTSELFPG